MIKKIFADLLRGKGSNNKGFDNNRYFDLIVRRTNLILLGVIGVLAICIAGLVSKVVVLNKLENVYVVSADKTVVASRSRDTMLRSDAEVYGFSRHFLEKVFANSRYSFDRNMKEIAEWMDHESAATLFATMTKAPKEGESSIEELYKEGNANSTVKLLKFKPTWKGETCQVTLTYQLSLSFEATGQTIYQDVEILGKAIFDARIVERDQEANWYGLQITKLQFQDLTEEEEKAYLQ